MKNIIESKFAPADVTAINDLIGDLETALADKTGVLTTEERRRYGSVNEQNKLIVNKAREYRQSQPALSAPNVDWDEFESDYQARLALENWINRLKAIVHDLESTKIMHDYDNYQDALKDYTHAQFQERMGEAGYSAKVEEYKQFFTKIKSSPPENGDGDGGGDGEIPANP